MNISKKILVLGANGQVASEILIEIKKQNPGANIVGLCRNTAGSLFLRYNKIPVVHGSLESGKFPDDLFKDADVIVNTIYLRGQPAEIKKRHEKILKTIFEHAERQAKIIHFSTVAIFHGGIYAKEKLHQEKMIRKLARQYDKKTIILRLGHVFGRSQGYGFTCVDLASQIKGRVLLPHGCNNDANCTSIKYLSDVILDIARKNFENNDVDIYTTVFNPAITWANVLNNFGLFDIDCQIGASLGNAVSLKKIVNCLFGKIRRNKHIHSLAMSLVRWMPFVEQRIYARHLISRAQEDISAIPKSNSILESELPMVQWPSAPGARYPLIHKMNREELLS